MGWWCESRGVSVDLAKELDGGRELEDEDEWMG